MCCVLTSPLCACHHSALRMELSRSWPSSCRRIPFCVCSHRSSLDHSLTPRTIDRLSTAGVADLYFFSSHWGHTPSMCQMVLPLRWIPQLGFRHCQTLNLAMIPSKSVSSFSYSWPIGSRLASKSFYVSPTTQEHVDQVNEYLGMTFKVRSQDENVVQWIQSTHVSNHGVHSAWHLFP